MRMSQHEAHGAHIKTMAQEYLIGFGEVRDVMKMRVPMYVIERHEHAHHDLLAQKHTYTHASQYAYRS